GGLESAAVLALQHLPAAGLEQRLELGGADTGDNAVEALAIEVDDPEDVAETLDVILEDGLPDVALVELGVAHQRDVALGGDVAEVELGVALDGCREGRRDRPEPDRAGRE